MIDTTGLSAMPITNIGLDYAVSSERVSSGVAALDEMLDGRGYFRGSSVLISGRAGDDSVQWSDSVISSSHLVALVDDLLEVSRISQANLSFAVRSSA